MGNKSKRIIICTILSLIILCTGGYVYKISEDRRIAQEKVIDKFINSIYKNKFTADDNNLKSLLSSQYSLEQLNMKDISVNGSDSIEANTHLNSYSISTTSKDKINLKKEVIYYVEVNFSNKEEVESTKKLYIGLIDENSEWKINGVVQK